MVQEEERWFAQFLPSQLPRIERAVRRRCRRLDWCITSDVKDECRQTATCSLWLSRARLRSLAGVEQQRYADTCSRHAIERVLAGEARQKTKTLSVEELRTEDDEPIELASELEVEWDALLDEIDLETHLAGLSAGEWEILYLYYWRGLTDREIAAREGTTPSASKMRRNRILAKLRDELVE